MLIAVASAVYAIVGIQAGRITVLFDNQRSPLVVAYVCLGTGLILLAFAPTISVAGISVAVIGVGLGITQPSIEAPFRPRPDRTAGRPRQYRRDVGRMTVMSSLVVMCTFVGAMMPLFGFGLAVRWTSLIIAVIGAGGGILLLVIAGVRRRYNLHNNYVSS